MGIKKMNIHTKKIKYRKKITVLLLLIYIVQLTYGLDPIHSKKYATLSFLKNRILQNLLFQAAKTGDAFAIIDAIKRNAPLNIQNDQGYTPLIVAVMNGHQAAVEALVVAGALVSIKDNAGKTALDYALHDHNKGITTLLLQNAKQY